MIDLNRPKIVDIEIAEDGKKLWVNADGVCQIRGYQIEQLLVTDTRRVNYIDRYGEHRKFETESEAVAAFESENPEARYVASQAVTKCYANLKDKETDQVAALIIVPWPYASFPTELMF